MAGKRSRGADLAQARQALNASPPAFTAGPTPSSAYWTEEAGPSAGQDAVAPKQPRRGRACERRRAFLGWSSRG
ncbi:hypothetical protein [Streptomyces sp. NPDC003006]